MNRWLTTLIWVWIFLAVCIWWYLWFNLTLWKNIEKKYNEQVFSNDTLKKEIDSIWNTTSKELNDKLTFYENYFKSKSEMYILEIFWLIEYALPDNNFVQSLTLNKDSSSISLDFQSPNIEDLIKLYRNLNKIKEMWLITEYSLREIKLKWEEWLKSTEIKKYTLEISLSPNVTSWNESIIEFLKKYDSYYRWIYSTTLKKIYCELYTTEDWKELCKTEEMLEKEKQEQLQEQKEEINTSK